MTVGTDPDAAGVVALGPLVRRGDALAVWVRLAVRFMVCKATI